MRTRLRWAQTFAIGNRYAILLREFVKFHTNGFTAMLSQYFFILIMSGLAVVLPLAAIVMGHFIGPRRPDEIKNDIYESGVETIGETWVQFRAQYYLIGLVFVVFDVEALFLFPIAVAYQELEMFAVLATIFFVLLLVIGLLYDWRKGALEWQ